VSRAKTAIDIADDALARTETLLGFDLRKLTSFGRSYNQAAKDVLDQVIATRILIAADRRLRDRLNANAHPAGQA
jgi:hypothetical protein